MNNENETKKEMEVDNKEKELSLSEIRRLICGEMEYTISVNKDVSICMKELTQKKLNEIDKEIQKRNIPQYIQYSDEEIEKIKKGELPAEFESKEYKNTMNILKITWAFQYMTFNGEKISIKDDNDVVVTDENKKREYIEKLLWGLGEGVYKALSLQYDALISQKFIDVKKN
jgi:predicted HTH domain antitoxin